MIKLPRNQSGFSIFEVVLVIVSIIVTVIVGSVVYVFDSINGECGPKSPTHKTEVSKVATFNAVTVMPGQPNQTPSIVDDTQGTCNLDVAQSYSATKNFAVNMNGATALSTVTDNLKKQGFKLSQKVFSDDQCNNVWGEANYSGKSIIITTYIGTPTKKCPYPDLISLHPNITEAQFDNTTITSVQAIVSTPDQVL